MLCVYAVSFNPIMSMWLTYHMSQSYAYSSTVPDENYAREIMQLFSIGLYELHLDGTRKMTTNAAGAPVPVQTYDSDDVVR